jgi:hypothetical protein
MTANTSPNSDHLELASQPEQMPRVIVCVPDRLRDNHAVTFTVSLEWKRKTGVRLLLRQLRHSDGGIGPHHRSPGYRQTPFDWHEILKSKQHCTLCKQPGSQRTSKTALLSKFTEFSSAPRTSVTCGRMGALELPNSLFTLAHAAR